MRRSKILWIFLLFFILLVNSPIYAVDIQLPEPSYSFYVYDEAGIIDRQVEEYIIATNKELYKKTGAQIVVATVLDLRGMDINRFATELFEKWGIGSREYDNGLLILVVPKERELWIEVGYGLEGPLPDSKVGNIIEKFILPYFRENKYSEGILSGFNAIINEVEKEYNIELGREEIDEELYYLGNDYGDISISSWSMRIFMIIGLILFIFIYFKFFNGLLTYSLLRGGRYRGGSGSYRGGFGGRRGGGSSGGGGRSGGGGAGGRW